MASTTSPLVLAVQRCDGALDTSFNGTGIYLNASFDSDTSASRFMSRFLSTGSISLLYIAGQNNPPFTADLVTLPISVQRQRDNDGRPFNAHFPTGINPRGGVATNYDGTFVVRR